MPTGESEAKAKTKARFEEVFRRYAELESDIQKPKKKHRHPPEQIVLETLRNNLDIAKETDNVGIEKNLHDAQDKIPKHTKNKLKPKTSMAELIHHDVTESRPMKSTKKKKKVAFGEQINTEESALPTQFQDFEGENDNVQLITSKDKLQQEAPVSKDVRKKSRSALKKEQYENDLEEEEQQLILAYQLQVSEEEANEIKSKIKKKLQQMDEVIVKTDNQDVTLNREVGRKKKKKEVAEASEAETSVMSISELQDIADEETSLKKKALSSRILALDSDKEGAQNVEQGREEDEIFRQKTKVKKTKKKTKKVSEDNTEIVSENSQEKEITSKRVIDENLVLGIYIHRTDKLKTDLMASHPIVKVHVIDEKTGLYVKKETGNRAVSSFSEQEKVEHILPIMTHPYDFKQLKSALPQWEEQIVFNERFVYLLQETEESPKVILFFELIEVLSIDDARANSEVQVQERGCRRIAWAFLKLIGANGVLNIDGKLRLQLYYPPARSRTQLSGVDVFEWWLKCPRNRYPSTLYVTVKGLKLPDHVVPSSRSMMGLQQELGTSSGDLQSAAVQKNNELCSDEKRMELVKWTKFPGQACRIPNKLLFSLRSGQQGCFSICFSHDGRTLAAACADTEEYPVLLYEIPSGRYLQELHGHLNIVYDICWSGDDKNLLTASSDGTVRLWNIETHTTSALKVFPHPSFVYTAKYHPVANYLVVTGCYDSVIRVWNVMAKEIHGQLLQELDGHKSFINTLCFDAEGLHMFSGDSSGLVIVWNTCVNEYSQQNPVQNWCIKKEIRENDLAGISVNHLQVHPNGRRLLIHAKDNTLRVMDLRILATTKYTGATNYSEKIHSTLTPCGTFLFSGSEDSLAYVWNTETGDQVAKYSDFSYTSPLRDVAYHPHEHMVAFCAFGQSQPILVYIYDHKVSQLEAEAIKDLNGSFTSAGPRRPMMLSGSDTATTLHEEAISPGDQFVNTVRSSMRLQKVKQKLDSVMDSLHRNVQPDGTPSMPWNLQKEYSVGSPVNSGFLYSQTGSNHTLPAPSLLSPHSKLRLPGTLGTQLIPHQSLMSQSGSFSPVGHPVGRSPSFRLQMTGNESSTASLKIEADRFMPGQETVVALYDYTAHRSDELTIHRSDIIQVLYKDNDSWWFGCLANGQQGYFPANYVAGETNYEENTSSSTVPDYAPLLPSAQIEAGEGSSTQQRMSAAITTSRDQTCIPPPDIDTSSPAAQSTKTWRGTPRAFGRNLLAYPRTEERRQEQRRPQEGGDPPDF